MTGQSKGTNQLNKRKRSLSKIVGISIGSVVGLLLILIIMIPTFISSDASKNRIVSVLESIINREVQIDDLNMSWSDGLDIRNVLIKERSGFPGDTFVKVRRIKCNIGLFSLIKKQIKIKDFLIDGPEVYLKRNKEGVFNYEDIVKTVETTSSSGKEDDHVPPATKKHSEQEEYPPIAAPLLFEIEINMNISNGKFAFIDLASNEKTVIKDFNTTLNINALDRPIEFKSEFDIEAKGKTEHANISLNISLAKDGKFAPEDINGVFNMQTSFAQITANFDMARFKGEGGTGLDLSLKMDLNELTEKFALMLALPVGMQMKGTVNSKFTATGRLDNIINISGNTEVLNLNISGGPIGMIPIMQPKLSLNQSIDIDIPGNNVNVHGINFNSNLADISINGLISDIKGKMGFDLTISMDSDIEKLVAGAGGLLPEDLNVAGKIKTRMNLKGQQGIYEVVGVTNIRGLLVQIGAIGPIKEPEVQITHNAKYSLHDGSATIDKLEIITNLVQINTSGTLNNNTIVDLEMDLSVSDIKKLVDNLNSIISLPEGLNVSGKLTEKVTIKGDIEKNINVNGEAFLQGINVSGGPLEGVEISNKDLKFIHILNYNILKDSVNVEALDISSDFLNITSKGTISGISTEQEIDYKLLLNADLGQTSALIAGMLPANTTMSGKGMVDIGLKGKMSAISNSTIDYLDICKNINFDANISLDEVKYDAYKIEDFQTRLKLNNGIFTTKDFVFKLNDGPGKIMAKADFNEKKPPVDFNMELSGVKINQKMDILAYLLPFLSTSNGQLSGELAMKLDAHGKGFDWQEDLSRTLNANGRIDIKDGYINGDKIMTAILRIVNKKRDYKFKDILADFRIRDSKVFTDDIQVNGEGLNLHFSGWTAFDGQMEYSVKVDALDRVAGRDAKKILGILGQGSLPIAITGSIYNPKVSFKSPKPGDIGNIIKGFIGGGEKGPASKDTTENQKEKQPQKTNIEDTVKSIFKQWIK